MRVKDRERDTDQITIMRYTVHTEEREKTRLAQWWLNSIERIEFKI